MKKNIHDNRFLCRAQPGFRYVLAVCLCSVLLLNACSWQKEESGSVTAGKSYFDLATVIQKDIDSNTQRHCGEEKFVLIDGIKENKRIDTVNWQEELKPLLECDINKPAWKGKFVVDTFQSDVTDLTTISYRALSERVNVKSLIVDYDADNIRKIRITKKINSFIFSSIQVIEYIPSYGFSIRGEQKAFMMKSFEMDINVKYSYK